MVQNPKHATFVDAEQQKDDQYTNTMSNVMDYSEDSPKWRGKKLVKQQILEAVVDPFKKVAKIQSNQTLARSSDVVDLPTYKPIQETRKITVLKSEPD